MAKVLAMQFSAAGQQSFVPDQDYLLSNCFTNSPTALVTLDPSLTLANISAPAANKNIWNIIHLSLSSNDPPRASVPLLKDRRIYVTAASAGTVFFYLEDAVDIPL